MPCAQHEQFKRSFGALELISFVFQLFDLLEDRGKFRAILGDRDIKFDRLLKNITFPRKIRDENAPFVAYLFWDNMFIREGVLRHRIYVNTGLVRKGAVSYIGLPLAVRQIREFIHITGYLSKFRQVRVGDAVYSHLYFERRDDGAKIRVSAPFAVSVDGPMYLHRSQPDRG